MLQEHSLLQVLFTLEAHPVLHEDLLFLDILLLEQPLLQEETLLQPHKSKSHIH